MAGNQVKGYQEVLVQEECCWEKTGGVERLQIFAEGMGYHHCHVHIIDVITKKTLMP